MKKYYLDNSAVIHLVSKGKKYTNSFRILVTLTEDVCPSTLQKALNRIAARFPTIVAGIRCGVFQYEVIPAAHAPMVQPEQECLAYMADDVIQTCAIRILYKRNRIAVEIFHALTDGYGGSVFVSALLKEYFWVKYGITEHIEKNPLSDGAGEGEIRDDFLTYAGREAVRANHRKVYRLPGNRLEEQKTHIITGIYPTQVILDIAHRFQVSLTTFLTAVLASSIIEMQRSSKELKDCESIQIMVPANLRKKFKSLSLRNFSLYALPCVETSHFHMPFGILINHIHGQLRQQLSKEHLSRMIGTNVRLQKMWLVRWMPLRIKKAVLQIVYYYFGERNSCLSLSNLGEITFADEIQPYIERSEFILSPRRNAPYNCGVSTYQGKLYINFGRRSEQDGLEKIFFQHLSDLGAVGMFEVDGKSFKE